MTFTQPTWSDRAMLARSVFGHSSEEGVVEMQVRFLTALALLCECAAYVDEPDFLDQIDSLLDSVELEYPLRFEREGVSRTLAIAPRLARFCSIAQGEGHD